MNCSYDRNGTFNFFMGMGKVITGIDVGMKGMCKWERREITIPPSMGYGNRHVGEFTTVRYWVMELTFPSAYFP